MSTDADLERATAMIASVEELQQQIEAHLAQAEALGLQQRDIVAELGRNRTSPTESEKLIHDSASPH